MTKKRKILIILIGIFILIIALLVVPFEQWLFRFETPEEALKFDYTAKVEKIIQKIELDDISLVIFENKEGNIRSKHLVKDDRGWKTSLRKFEYSNKSKITFTYSINSYPEGNRNIMIITSGALKKEQLVKSVSDNNNTHFESKNYEYNGVYYADWVGIINEYPENYILYVDGTAVKI